MRSFHWMYLSLISAFLLGIHEGNLALWKEPEPQPIAVFPLRAELLPQADREALEKGIRAETVEDLHRLLEDFLS